MPAQPAKLSIPTPGARVIVRDAEWIVRRVDHAPGAVSRAREHFIQRRDAFEEIINAKLEDEVAALDEFKARQLRQLELDLDQFPQAEQFKRRRDEQARHDIQTIHDEYLTWIEETMTTEPHPWIKVICAMTAPANLNRNALNR